MSESCKLKLFRQAVLRSAGCHRSVEKKLIIIITIIVIIHVIHM